jgi:MFS transporter, SP family, general alpha glucoside:H+ symporter
MADRNAQITRGASYLDCFRGTDLRRTEVCGFLSGKTYFTSAHISKIVCMVWAIQNLSGNSFSNYST